MQADFCSELLKALKEQGIHTAVDTSGFVSRTALDKVIPYTDVFLYDVKAYNDEVHIKCTGASNKQILDNLRYLDSIGKSIEIRIPYVPSFNSDELEDIAAMLKELRHITKIRLLKYHSLAASKYSALGMECNLPSVTPTDSEIENAAKLIHRITGFEISV